MSSDSSLVRMQGGWGGLLTSLAGALVFTLGTMSHHSTYEGTDPGWGLTLTSAAIAAALARHYYLKAIVGVAGMLCNLHIFFT